MAERMFILKRSLVFTNSDYGNFYRKLQHYVKTKRDIDQMINLNAQHLYTKGILVKKGDYLTCCSVEESINPDESFTLWKDGSWQRGKVFQADSVQVTSTYYAVFPKTGIGVYASGVRLSTEEEIENYKKSQNG